MQIPSIPQTERNAVLGRKIALVQKPQSQNQMWA
jgi:hypothetical protein